MRTQRPAGEERNAACARMKPAMAKKDRTMMDIQLQHALHKALRADPDPTQMKSRLPQKILLVVP